MIVSIVSIKTIVFGHIDQILWKRLTLSMLNEFP